jgi:hypothetical protein
MALRLLPRHLFSVDDYHRMLKAGILSEDDWAQLPSLILAVEDILGN